jgi:uncharacterized hydrophobic protein (TIGR00271 family)
MEEPKAPLSSDTESEFKPDVDHTNLWRRFKLFWLELRRFLGNLLSIRHDTDYEKTREGIIRDVTFKGHTVYILICSIFIASIGLNLNSPAVIIGAMLIAPLMGPILGAGFALGVNDVQLLIKSMKNFGVMVFISLATSTMYFLLTPLVEYQPELLARTKPTTLDIFVAIFGGIAGIVAGSRKEKSNVIPGVAIATALMPPLCTSGFGLATGNMAFFFGAFYLFLLNSVFICASTVIGVRYLRFPLTKFLNKKREKKVRFYMALFMTIIIIPSLWIFWGVLRESYFKSQAEAYIAQVVKMQGSRVVNTKLIFGDDSSIIELFIIGNEVPDDTIAVWRAQMEYYGLHDTKLEVYGSGRNATDDQEMAVLSGKLRADIVEDLFARNQAQLAERDGRIRQLEIDLQRASLSGVNLLSLSKELSLQFEHLEQVAYANTIESKLGDHLDTIPTFMVKWKAGTARNTIERNEEVMAGLMKLRLQLDTVRIVRY